MAKNPIRRRLLTTLAFGAAAETHRVLLPGRWTTPVVEAVVLPAHAQTSPPPAIGCNAGSITVDNTTQGGQAQGHVAIIYDGSQSCSLRQVITDSADGGASGDPDEMLLIDADSVALQVTDFDLRGRGYLAHCFSTARQRRGIEDPVQREDCTMMAEPLTVEAPSHVQRVISGIGRTEDIKLSPDNRRLALVDFLEDRDHRPWDAQALAGDSRSQQVRLFSSNGGLGENHKQLLMTFSDRDMAKLRAYFREHTGEAGR